MKFMFAGAEHKAYEFVMAFTFDGRLFSDGGVIIVKSDGARTAVTREDFARWWLPPWHS